MEFPPQFFAISFLSIFKKCTFKRHKASYFSAQLQGWTETFFHSGHNLNQFSSAAIAVAIEHLLQPAVERGAVTEDSSRQGKVYSFTSELHCPLFPGLCPPLLNWMNGAALEFCNHLQAAITEETRTLRNWFGNRLVDDATSEEG